MASDIDQALSNAVAGGVSFPIDLLAWGLRKAGVPVNKPVLGSDWMREKGLTKEVPEQAQMGGDIASMMLPGGATAKMAVLLPGLLRKDLIVSTASKTTDLLRSGRLARELYNPSFAITSNKVSPFSASWTGGPNNVTLIPRYGAIDPKRAPVVVAPIDAYTPRRSDATGASVEEKAKFMSPWFSDEDYMEKLKVFAQDRLTDKFISRYPQGGRGGEATGRRASIGGIPKYGQPFDTSFLTVQPLVKANITPSHWQAIGMSDKFPTLEHYEKSPYGAKRLTEGPEYVPLYNQAAALEDYYGADALGSILKDYNHNEHKRLRELLKQLRSTRSEYGELKRFGPMQLNPENFAGALVDLSPGHWSTTRFIEQLRARNVPVETFSSNGGVDPKELFILADALQQAAK